MRRGRGFQLLSGITSRLRLFVVEASPRILEIADQRLDGLDGIGAVRPHGDFLVFLDRQQHQLDRTLGADRLAVLDHLDIGFETLGELDGRRVAGRACKPSCTLTMVERSMANTLVLGATPKLGGGANALRRRW